MFSDRVLETSTSTGNSTITLAGARTGYETFNTAFGTTVPFYYVIVGVDANDVPTGEWEVGIGSLSASTTLVRDVILQSSNSDAVVTLSAGTKLVFSDLPATPLKMQNVYNILNNPMVQL